MSARGTSSLPSIARCLSTTDEGVGSLEGTSVAGARVGGSHGT